MKFSYTRFQARKYLEEAGEGGEGEGSGEGGEGGSADMDAIKTQLAEIQAAKEASDAENERLLHKINEANKHKKEAEKTAKEEARKKAEAEGNFEQLFKSSEHERESLQSQLNDMMQANERKEVNTAALKLASEMAEGANVELLSEFISRRLKFADNGIKVTDEAGNLTVSTLDDLKSEFLGSSRYASLIKGNQSSGGGASGGSGGSGAAKEISRADFSKLDPAAKMKFTKDGGKVVD